MQESKDRVIDHFSRCFPDADFVQIEELEHTIKKSGFKKENKEAMPELVNYLQHIQSVDQALDKMVEAGFDTKRAAKNSMEQNAIKISDSLT